MYSLLLTSLPKKKLIKFQLKNGKMAWCLYILLICRGTKHSVLYDSHLFQPYKSDNS